MRITSPWVLAPSSVIVSAGAAYLLVFVLPPSQGYDVFDYIDTWTPKRGSYYDTSFDYFVPDEVRSLAQRHPVEAQTIINELWGSLVKSDEGTLYRMKWLPDVCIELDCKGLPSADIKPVIDYAISFKQSADKTWRELVTLSVSITALFVSMIGLFIRRRGTQ